MYNGVHYHWEYENGDGCLILRNISDIPCSSVTRYHSLGADIFSAIQNGPLVLTHVLKDKCNDI